MTTARRLIPVLLVVLGLSTGVGCGDDASPAAPTGETVAPADTLPMTGVEKAYLEFVLNHLETVDDDLATLGLLLSSPDVDDEYWQASVTTLLNRIELAHESIASLEPTERLQPFQAAAEGSLEHAAAFAKALRDMLTAGTTTLSDEAAQEFVKTREGFDEVQRLFSEFLSAHPVPEGTTSGVASGS